MFVFESNIWYKMWGWAQNAQKLQVHAGQKASLPLLPERQHTGWRSPRLPVPTMQDHRQNYRDFPAPH